MLRGENIGMKIRKKFVGKIALDGVPDSADGARAAITNAAQTVSGQKNFHANVSVKQDSSQGNKKLICKADVDDLLNKLPGAAIESVELTQEHVSGRGFSLSKGVAEGYELMAKCKCEGSDWLYAGVDFDLSGKALSWSNYLHVQAKLQAGDKVLVRYIAKGGA